LISLLESCSTNQIAEQSMTLVRCVCIQAWLNDVVKVELV